MKFQSDYQSAAFNLHELSIPSTKLFQYLLRQNKTITNIPVSISARKLTLLTMPKQYYDFLTSKGIRLYLCKANIGAHTICIFDKKNNTLYRCSFSQLGNAKLLSNVNFIKQKYPVPYPRKCNLVSTRPFVITEEELLTGSTLTPNQWHKKHTTLVSNYLQNLFEATKREVQLNLEKEFAEYDSLCDLYSHAVRKSVASLRVFIQKQHKSSCKAKVNKAVIHGDLTYRNVLVHNSNAYFVDFDRSTFSFPEFDYYLLAIDLQTYKDPQVDYFTFFKHCINHVKDPESLKIHLPKYIEFYYIKYDNCVRKVIRYLFVYRMLVLSLQNIPDDNDKLRLANYVVELFNNDIKAD